MPPLRRGDFPVPNRPVSFPFRIVFALLLRSFAANKIHPHRIFLSKIFLSVTPPAPSLRFFCVPSRPSKSVRTGFKSGVEPPHSKFFRTGFKSGVAILLPPHSKFFPHRIFLPCIFLPRLRPHRLCASFAFLRGQANPSAPGLKAMSSHRTPNFSAPSLRFFAFLRGQANPSAPGLKAVSSHRTPNFFRTPGIIFPHSKIRSPPFVSYMSLKHGKGDHSSRPRVVRALQEKRLKRKKSPENSMIVNKSTT